MNEEDITKIESNVRAYCRSFPIVFNKAQGSILYTESGQKYIDFFAGAGALNYGHNNKQMKQALISYLSNNYITHGLDFYTTAKRNFLSSFKENILQPRKLDYKVQFCGPTGTNAVEAAIKLARKVTGRTGIFSFMGGFHGMTLGSLALTGNKYHRAASGTILNNVNFMPYPAHSMTNFDSINYINAVLEDPNSGIEKPAAIIFETTQAEGGVNITSNKWLKQLKLLSEIHDILLICDDIQVGCGRTGTFFSFERAEIVPDIVVLSKSISGYGLPFALALYKPHLDIWQAGEHNGTFRGNQLAFVTGAVTLDYYWSDSNFTKDIILKEHYLQYFLETEIQALHPKIQIRGIGLIWGIDLSKLNQPELVNNIIKACFNNGLVIESTGRNGQVLKLLPALTIEKKLLSKGCNIIKQALFEILTKSKDLSD